MKQWIVGLAVAALAAAPAMASAQSAVGLRAGARWSQLETSQEAGSLTSLVLGGYFGFGISDRLAVQLEAVYGSRGAGELGVGTDALDPQATPAQVDMTYLEVPVLLRAGFPGERFLPSFFLGPYAGFLLDCDLSVEGEETRACDEEGATQRFSPRGTDFGILVGGALDMAVGESTVFVDVRYTLGLLSLESGDEAFDARHGGLAVSGGFAVPLGR